MSETTIMSAGSPRVFLVDDDKDTLAVLSHVFASFGATVITCSESVDAVETFRNHSRKGGAFNLVALDIRMPKVNGYSIAAQIRDEGYTGMLVALTANPTGDGRKISKDSGFDAYIGKHKADKKVLGALLGR